MLLWFLYVKLIKLLDKLDRYLLFTDKWDDLA